ncbi:MAG TPA: hypothetical protein VMO47_15195 [Rhodothermales bacterium]|nr:hypothetical protein [Rhodothermales bacterium]
MAGKNPPNNGSGPGERVLAAADEAKAHLDASVTEATRRVETATKRLATEIEKLVSDGVHTVQSVASDYAEKLGESAAYAQKHAKKAYEGSQEYVKENPVPSVLGAFAIGILLGILLRRN